MQHTWGSVSSGLKLFTGLITISSRFWVSSQALKALKTTLLAGISPGISLKEEKYLRPPRLAVLSVRNIYHCSYCSLQSLFLSNACDQRSLPYLKAFLPHQTQIMQHSPTHKNFMLLENYWFQISQGRSFTVPLYSVEHDVLFSEAKASQRGGHEGP